MLGRGAKSSHTWNSDCASNKRNLVRENPDVDSNADDSHKSFPIHGLGDDEGYESRLAVLTADDENMDDGDANSEDLPQHASYSPVKKRGAPFEGNTTCDGVMKIPKVVTDIIEGRHAPKKLLLRPYGTGETALIKAERLQDVLREMQDEGSSANVVIGDRVSDLCHLCGYVDASKDLDKSVPARVLHRESSVDVRVVESGAFGRVVQKTYLKQTMRWPFRCHTSMQEQLLYEASILKSLAHVPGVIRLLGWCYDDEKNGSMEAACRNKSLLFQYIDKDHSPKEPVKMFSYMSQLLTALDHLHYRGIVHCNVKRENVLFDGDRLTVIDFETAVNEHELIDMGKDDYDEEVGVYYRSNPYFSAPEVLEKQRGKNKHGTGILYGHRRDVWGAGVILAELLLGMDPDTHVFPKGSREVRIQARRDFCQKLGPDGSVLVAFKGLRSYSNGIIPSTKFYKHGADLVKQMTLWSRFQRARAWEALQHSFFNVDPADTLAEPEFETLQKDKNRLWDVDEIEEDDGEDDHFSFDVDGFHGEDDHFSFHREDRYLFGGTRDEKEWDGRVWCSGHWWIDGQPVRDGVYYG
eukprot:TRINITY_DN3718_c0_g1_i1.p1 TRINITY_DN3718_c0_g1~~TRINITY_DN3718_c0_g1_i1.p1  ORF type:complete len:580 (+),score=53.97 TRINITY_DN3718_c0_g1_i1:131-1870(+)